MLLAPQSMLLSSYHPKSSKIDIISLTLKKSLNFPSRNCCDSRKILSQNFLFLELRSPGKFCPGKKIVLEFSKNNSTKNGHSRNLQSWNFPFLEFIFVLELSVPGILFHGIYLLPFRFVVDQMIRSQRIDALSVFDVFRKAAFSTQQ